MIDEILKEGVIQEYRTLILGILVALIVMYLPRGLIGTIEVGMATRRRRRAAEAEV